MRNNLYVLIGKPGEGKSYVANLISNMTGSIHLNVDRIRKNKVTKENQEPKYTSEESKKTYNTLLTLAEEKYLDGQSVVLDGTFNIRDGRKRAKQIAGSDTVFIRVICTRSEAKKRLEKRDGISDADPDLYDTFNIQPIKYEHIVIDNSGSKSETKKQIQEKLF